MSTEKNMFEKYKSVPRFKFLSLPFKSPFDIGTNYYSTFYSSTAPVGQSLLIVEASRSHSETPHSVGLLWRSDQPDAITST
jgi:hypothetical protein